jgi:trimethylamine---corrinoid protein Co-methyltransferase
MSAPEPPAPRRARPGARAARQKERAAPPYLTRAIPPYELLSEEGLGQVERHADQLLEEIGLEIRGDLEAIRLWRAAGARISGDWRVHVPRGLAREIVRRSAPREFTQHARNPARSVPIGGSDQLQRANRRWKGLLEAYERPPLDAAREEALFDYVARRERSMPDELG